MTPQRPRSADAIPKAVESIAGLKAQVHPFYAALDLGTNSCRMLIAQPDGAQFKIVDSFSKSVQLGHGLEESGRLSRVSMDRTLQALRVCSQKLRQYRVKKMRLVATEACRRAANGPELVDVQPNLRSPAIMHMHRGFRSGERPNKYGAKVVDWISVPLGVATLRDLFNDVDDDAGRFALMSLLFEEKLESFIPYDRAYKMEHFQIIGTSGTVTTVAASHLGLRRYDRNKVDGLAMSSIEIDKVIHDYLRLGPVGRQNDPRIGKDRQALIMSGAAILQALLRCWPTHKLSVADRGLREGLLYAQMSADGVLREQKS